MYEPFKPKEYNIYHEECWVKFECPSCHASMHLDSQDGPKTCECGKRYSVTAILYHVDDEKK